MGASSSAPKGRVRSHASKDGKLHKILCYGDSNTAGFHNGGRSFEPYANSLKKALAEQGVRAEIAHAGLSGLTCQEMVEKASQGGIEDVCGICHDGLEKMLQEQGPFQLAIIMAGTNDLGGGRPAKEVLENTKALHRLCHQDGVTTFALVGPQVLEGPSRDARVVYADYLEKWAKNCQGVQHFADVEELAPRSMTQYWERDGLHFAPKGSRQLGQALCGKVVEALQAVPSNVMSSYNPACEGPDVGAVLAGLADLATTPDDSPAKSQRDGMRGGFSSEVSSSGGRLPGSVLASRIESTDSMAGVDPVCNIGNLPWPFNGMK